MSESFGWLDWLTLVAFLGGAIIVGALLENALEGMGESEDKEKED